MKNITLVRSFTRASLAEPHVWPLQVTATGLDGAPSAIFVYARAKAGDPAGDLFQCVASVPQLEELATQPIVVDDATQIPFYRASTATFACRSAEEADHVWSVIQQDTQALLLNLAAMDSLGARLSVNVTAEAITLISP